jgi:asparagine synthase (glutamine-hydrolysing)
VLSGEGADEVFGGYAHFRQDLITQAGERGDGAALANDNLASAGIMLPDGERLATHGVNDVLGYVPTWLDAKATLGFRVTSLLSDDFHARFATRDPYREIAEAFDASALAHRERIDRSAYTWCKLVLATYILRTLGDGMEMAHAVEGRLPFLDHRLFELARALPTRQRIDDDMVEKSILRSAAASIVPAEIIARRKHPLLAPPLSLFGDGAFERTREELTSSRLPDFIDREKVAQRLERLASAPPDERRAWDPALMLALTAMHLGARYGMAAP